MGWELKPIPAPLLSELEGLATSISSITQPVVTALDTAQAALDVAKAFVTTSANPTTALALALIDELENLNNDIFGTGVFQLVVQPFDASARKTIPRIGEIPGFNAADTLIEIEQAGSTLPANFLGVPSLTPERTIRLITQSFDDEGDAQRPQFSDSASVTAFGFLVTAPDADEFASLLESLRAVFDLGPFERLLERLKRVTNLETGGIAPPISRLPDWDSVRLNSVSPLKETQDFINKQLNFLRGLVGVGDNALQDFIELIERKVSNLQAIIQEFNELINSIKSALNASGIWVLDVPPGVGGNNRLKQEIESNNDVFNQLNNNLSAAVLYVGGGPSLASVNAIRTLVSQ